MNVEGNLYPWISLLDVGRDIMLILKDGRKIMATCRGSNPPTIEE
jgi:hypothetical protein